MGIMKATNSVKSTNKENSTKTVNGNIETTVKSKKMPAMSPKAQSASITGDEDPVLTLVSKKLRSLRKKMEKIKQLEYSIKEEGKIVNEQQLEVLNNKPATVKLLTEYENLFTQIAEIQLAKAKTEKEKVPAKEEPNEQAKPKADECQKAEQATADAASMTDIKPVQEKAQEPQAPQPDGDLKSVETMLRLIHVVTMQQALGKPVPSPLDFFLKVIFGNTRPPAELSFEENLQESMEEVRKYLAKSKNVVACDMTYEQLQQTVEDVISPPEPEPVEPAVPHFNFFTESQLDTPDTPVNPPAPVEVEEVVEVQPSTSPQDSPTNSSKRSQRRGGRGGRDGGQKYRRAKQSNGATGGGNNRDRKPRSDRPNPRKQESN